MREGIVLSFFGRTTAPFHTTRMEYSNLVKCAPFILGSTIRGALLKRLLERGLCPHVSILDSTISNDAATLAEIHRLPDAQRCSVTPFFPAPQELPNAWFSFGQFDVVDFVPYRSTTRIALERPFGSVAEGAIVTIEAVQPNVPFQFEVILFGEAQAMAQELIRAADETGRGEGWGRYRSIGYGQFVIERWNQITFADHLARAKESWRESVEGGRIGTAFETPYVLRGQGDLPPFQADEFAQYMRTQLQRVLNQVGEDAVIPPLVDVRVTLKPDFISRYSYEIGNRSNRLVTLEGSTLALGFDGEPAPLIQALACASVLGLGEWNEMGFGRLRPDPNPNLITARQAAREIA